MKRLIYAAYSPANYTVTHIEYAGRSCIVMLQDISNGEVVEYIIGQPGNLQAESKARELLNSDNIDIPDTVSNEITRTFFEI